jgi:hypothetical protein
MAAWPGTLPLPLADGYSSSLPNNLLVSDVSNGPAKVRRRTTANSYPIKMRMRLTPTQHSTFLTFYSTTLFSGATTFTFTHPETGATVSARFNPKTTPSWVPVGALDRLVSFELEIMP